MAVMLDSGAFSVWKSGATIAPADYVAFCTDHPAADHFVTLDVIPESGKDVERAASASWDNYVSMCELLGKSKVIPVYHVGEHVRWIEKYLSSGCRYLGLGGLVGKPAASQRQWLASVRPVLFPGGNPVVKLHGFGLTSFDLMRFWQWHSVDSTTWHRHAMVYQVLVPERRGGAPDYARPPLPVSVSPRVSKGSISYFAMPPAQRISVDAHLALLGTEVGEVEVYRYDGAPDEGDQYCDRAKGTAMRVIKRGVCNDAAERMRVNAHFFRSLIPHYPVRRVYLVGACGSPVQGDVADHLVSYNAMRTRSGKTYEGFVKLLGGGA